MTNKQIEEFLGKLEGPEGCNFKEDETWQCEGGSDKSLSRAILCNMGITKEEIKDFLNECEELGGHCDCEIIFNAAKRLKGGRDEVQNKTSNN